jgi:replicative DNA helicase
MIDQFNIEAEQAVIGALLRDNDAIDRIPELDAAHFYRGDHRTVFAEIATQLAAAKRIDAVTLAEQLGRKDPELFTYLLSLHASAPSSARIQYHAQIVIEKATKRALSALSIDLAADADSVKDSTECIADAAARLDTLAQRKTAKEPRRLDATLDEYLTLLQHRMDGLVRPIPTGYTHLDDMLDGGLERGTLTVIAGRPGTGKTAAGLGICRNVARDHSSLFLSMEMSVNQVNDRNIAALAGVDIKWLRRPGETRDDTERWDAISHATINSRKLNLFIDDQTGLSIPAIRAKARKIKRQHGLDLICIDQLSFITGAKADKLHEAMGEYTRGLIAIGKELDAVIVLLAQLNRECEKRHDKRPIMSDLGVSGYIEQDAANIIFLYRDELWNPDSEDRGICEWIGAKLRQGQPGTVGLKYIGAQTRFETPTFRWFPRQRESKPAPKSGGFE